MQRPGAAATDARHDGAGAVAQDAFTGPAPMRMLPPPVPVDDLEGAGVTHVRTVSALEPPTKLCQRSQSALVGLRF